jgi:hypothetical protein
MLYVCYVLLTNAKHKPIFSSERMLHEDYNRKDSVEQKSLVVILKGLGAKTNWSAVNRQS